MQLNEINKSSLVISYHSSFAVQMHCEEWNPVYFAN